jgi:hypothetical protein
MVFVMKVSKAFVVSVVQIFAQISEVTFLTYSYIPKTRK